MPIDVNADVSANANADTAFIEQNIIYNLSQRARGGDCLREQARRPQRGNPALVALYRARENGLSPSVSGELTVQQSFKLTLCFEVPGTRC